VSISKIPAATCWRLSRGPTAAAAVDDSRPATSGRVKAARKAKTCATASGFGALRMSLRVIRGTGLRGAEGSARAGARALGTTWPTAGPTSIANRHHLHRLEDRYGRRPKAAPRLSATGGLRAIR
jgi:hypothetical protein